MKNHVFVKNVVVLILRILIKMDNFSEHSETIVHNLDLFFIGMMVIFAGISITLAIGEIVTIGLIIIIIGCIFFILSFIPSVNNQIGSRGAI